MFKTTIAAAAAAVAFAPAAALAGPYVNVEVLMLLGLETTILPPLPTFTLVTKVKLALLPTTFKFQPCYRCCGWR